MNDKAIQAAARARFLQMGLNDGQIDLMIETQAYDWQTVVRQEAAAIEAAAPIIRAKAEAKAEALLKALTPSGDTKAAYHGEFWFRETYVDELDNEHWRKVYVPWDTVKQIMAVIKARALAAGEAQHHGG